MEYDEYIDVLVKRNISKFKSNDKKTIKTFYKNLKKYKIMNNFNKSFYHICQLHDTELPFTSKEGHKIYLSEFSFHEAMLLTNKNDDHYWWFDTTGAYCCYFYYENEDGDSIPEYYIIINSDVYDYYNKYEATKNFKYLAIAHEIGHCLNDDPLHPLDHDFGDKPELRMYEKDCIDRELNADKLGYDIIEKGFFGDFCWNKYSMTNVERQSQHVLNWLFCRFGKDNIDKLMKFLGIPDENYVSLGSRVLMIDKYLNVSPEDQERLDLFKKTFNL